MNEHMDWSNTSSGTTNSADVKFTPQSPSWAGGPGPMLPELLNGFIAEVKSYLPKVEHALAQHYVNPQQTAHLAEAQRHIRTLKGAAAVVGLTLLSDVAITLEELLEKLVQRETPLQADLWGALQGLLRQLDHYLNQVAAGQFEVPLALTEALRTLRQVDGLQVKSYSKGTGLRFATPSTAFPVAAPLPPLSSEPVAAPASAPVPPTAAPAAFGLTEDASDGPMGLQDLSAWLDLNETEDFLPLNPFAQRSLSPFGAPSVPPANAVAAPPTEATPPPATVPPPPPASQSLPMFLQTGNAGPDLSAWLDLSDENDLLDPLPLNLSATPAIYNVVEPAPGGGRFSVQAETTDWSSLADLVPEPPSLKATSEQCATNVSTCPSISSSIVSSPTTEQRATNVSTSAAGSKIESAPVTEATSESRMPEISAELLEVFLPEAEEHLRVMTLSLPALAAQPGNKSLLQEIRRSAHSLKGSAAVVGFEQVAKLAHRAEDLLDLLYEGELTLTAEHLQVLFASTEALENLLNNRPTQGMLTALYETYAELLDSHAEASKRPAAPTPVESEPDAVVGERPHRNTKPLPHEMPSAAGQSAPAAEPIPATVVHRGKDVRVPIERLDAVVKLVTELLVTQAGFEQNMGRLQRQLEEIRDNSLRLARVSAKMEVQFEASTLGGKPLASPAWTNSGNLPPSAGKPRAGATWNSSSPELFSAPAVTSQTYGFDALEFDRYTEFHLLLRELTEATSDVQTLERELNEVKTVFESSLNRQARLCSEIQEQLMRLRMVPLSSLSTRLHRTAHTVAARRDKLVDFAIEGEDTRLDKTVIEEIADPLLHLLRNAIDHGIEPAAVRQAQGKAAKGTIRLRAFHEGTQTVIQIGDDGAGLDVARIAEKALKSGLLNPAERARMSDEELFALIFLPGFSTAAEVSEISGRGVGMDVVKSTVHRLKGSIAVDSRAGAGTVFTLRLPMTLAVMRALMVRNNQQTYAIPVAGLSQVVKLTPNVLERIGQDTVVRTEGRVYPLLQLSQLLNLPAAPTPSSNVQMALLMTLDERQVAIAVDETLGGREIVVKNLGNHLRRVHGVTGATLLGDGQVVLILNLLELVRDIFRPRATMMDMRPETRMEARTETKLTNAPTLTPTPSARPADAPLTVMVVDDSLSVRRVLSNRLSSAGWTPLQAKDGLDALEQLQHMTIPPDLVLVDIEMPRMDGYEFISTLRKQDDYKDLPMIVLTSRAGQKHRERAFDVGATEYLVKPYQDDVLLSLIRRLADQSATKK